MWFEATRMRFSHVQQQEPAHRLYAWAHWIRDTLVTRVLILQVLPFIQIWLFDVVVRSDMQIREGGMFRNGRACVRWPYSGSGLGLTVHDAITCIWSYDHHHHDAAVWTVWSESGIPSYVAACSAAAVYPSWVWPAHCWYIVQLWILLAALLLTLFPQRGLSAKYKSWCIRLPAVFGHSKVRTYISRFVRQYTCRCWQASQGSHICRCFECDDTSSHVRTRHATSTSRAEVRKLQLHLQVFSWRFVHACYLYLEIWAWPTAGRRFGLLWWSPLSSIGDFFLDDCPGQPRCDYAPYKASSGTCY